MPKTTDWKADGIKSKNSAVVKLLSSIGTALRMVISSYEWCISKIYMFIIAPFLGGNDGEEGCWLH